MQESSGTVLATTKANKTTTTTTTTTTTNSNNKEKGPLRVSKIRFVSVIPKTAQIILCKTGPDLSVRLSVCLSVSLPPPPPTHTHTHMHARTDTDGDYHLFVKFYIYSNKLQPFVTAAFQHVPSAFLGHRGRFCRISLISFKSY